MHVKTPIKEKQMAGSPLNAVTEYSEFKILIKM